MLIDGAEADLAAVGAGVAVGIVLVRLTAVGKGAAALGEVLIGEGLVIGDADRRLRTTGLMSVSACSSLRELWLTKLPVA